MKPKILLGPGPSMVPEEVYQAMQRPVVGYLDPELFEVLTSIQKRLRLVFQTQNEVALALPGTGMSGMEAALGNLIEPGDSVIIAVHGFFGARMVEIARRYGANCKVVQQTWGQPIDSEMVEAALKETPNPRLVAIVHAETSIGIAQPIQDIARLAHDYGALMVVDCVTSLGGMAVDTSHADIAFSAMQKCIGGPPGLAPITVSPRAWERIQTRRLPNLSWYLDLRLLYEYWNEPHIYHHTASPTLLYAMDAALRLIEEEGLENRYRRHLETAQALWQGLGELGFRFMIDEPNRLPMLTSIEAPVNEAELRQRLLQDCNIEIGGGLGEWKGKVWRIGLMGRSCTRENVDLLLGALTEMR